MIAPRKPFGMQRTRMTLDYGRKACRILIFSHRNPNPMKVLSVLRVLPFTALALASIWAANRAPDGRRPPQMDFTVTPEAIANALTKVPHIASMAMLFVLAVLATGYSRIWLAAVLTFLVGVSWELVQTTVIGHNPRVVDIFPNLVGIAVAWIIVSVSVFLWRSARSRSSRIS